MDQHNANAGRLAGLEAEARAAREAFETYKSEVYGAPSSSSSKMRKLKQDAEYADARLERARLDLKDAPPEPSNAERRQARALRRQNA